MTHTKHTQSARTTIALSAAAGLALIVGIALRADEQAHGRATGQAKESIAVAEWARGEGLAGLSPASLTIAPQTTPDLATRVNLERTAIAEWARSKDLSGLSPVSLAPSG